MSPSVVSSVNNFVTAVIGIFTSLLQSILSVFQAILALGWDIVGSTLTVAKHIIVMFLDLFQGVAGFVAANFLAIAAVGFGYWLYTNRNNIKSQSKSRS